MESLFGILSFALSFGFTIPYAVDIVRGRARPARSTRILLLLLMTVTLVVQAREFTSWVLLLTIGEVLSQILLFGLGIRYGVGGLSRVDVICYVAFGISLGAYLLTQDAVLSLLLLMATDSIAFAPTILKIWRDPASDSWVFFFFGGVAAAFASLLATSSTAFAEWGFPTYLLVANALAAAPIMVHVYRSRRLAPKHRPVAPL